MGFSPSSHNESTISPSIVNGQNPVQISLSAHSGKNVAVPLSSPNGQDLVAVYASLAPNVGQYLDVPLAVHCGENLMAVHESSGSSGDQNVMVPLSQHNDQNLKVSPCSTQMENKESVGNQLMTYLLPVHASTQVCVTMYDVFLCLGAVG